MRKKRGTTAFISIWFLLFAVIVALTIVYKGESFEFYGIAESKEISVSFDRAVEIEEIFMVEGQKVNKGDILAKMRSPELAMQISQINHLIEKSSASKSADKSKIISNIKQLKAEKRSILNELNFKIKQLKNRYDINKSLTAKLKSIKPVSRSAKKNPIILQIESWETEKKLAVKPLNIRIRQLRNQMNSNSGNININLDQLNMELDLLKEKEKTLSISSPISGVVGTIHYKKGEKVTPFATIITVSNSSPTYIKGYIHEKMYSRIDVGKSVMLTSSADARETSKGVVVGVGSRIVEYPQRLKKHPDSNLWGREVIIKIDSGNKFLLGEKMRISSTGKNGISFSGILLTKVRGIFSSNKSSKIEVN